jgi:hypothetical protein
LCPSALLPKLEQSLILVIIQPSIASGKREELPYQPFAQICLRSLHSPLYRPLSKMRWLLRALAVVLCSASKSPTHDEHQLPFLADDNANTLPSKSSRVYGNNNATYGPVPEEEQLFKIEFLEIAPSPFEVYANLSIYPAAFA